VWTICECKEKRLIERLFSSSQITPQFQQKSLADFQLGNRPQMIIDAYHCTKAYVESFSDVRDGRQNSISLLGMPGSGKTHLLMAAANQLLADGVGVLYFPWVEGFNDLKANFDLLEDKIYRMQTVDVLYIDDLYKGRGKPTEFQTEQLFAIINYRYLNNKPIMISSERDVEEMCGFDMATGSRIYEMCKDFTVVLKGDMKLNYRLTE